MSFWPRPGASWRAPATAPRGRRMAPQPLRPAAGGGGGDVAVDTALPAPRSIGASGASGLIEQTLAVAHRAVVRTLRQRALLIFPMVFPLILFAINGSSLAPATRIPGFPTDNYRDFLIAMPFIQGAMFVSIGAGVDLARDIETGSLSRLALPPLRGEGALALGFGFAIALLVITLAFSQSAIKTRLARK